MDKYIINNRTMLTDLYQLTMMQGYFHRKYNPIAIFDLYFRKRDDLNYGVFCGIAQVIEYIQNLKFDKDDINYLRDLKIFKEDFLQYLLEFKFSGNIFSVEDGEIVFDEEPLIIVEAKIIEAQLIETALLNIVGHQTLVASKASRINFVANGSKIVEFGVRRAHGFDAGVFGSRAAVIGGCYGTSNVEASKRFGIKAYGTHSHSWVLSFATELEAFETYAEMYPDSCMLLVDSYDTLKSGVPNAIKVFDGLRQQGHKPLGIRLDSGDLAYLSKEARNMLDKAGYKDVDIFASGDIDEFVIESLYSQGARINSWGVGGKLITGDPYPLLGCVYKLAGIADDNMIVPKIKYSDNINKTTNPGNKVVYRLYDKDVAIADLIALKDEIIKTPLTLTHKTDRWKKLEIKQYVKRELLVQIYKKGQKIYNIPSLNQSIKKCQTELSKFWDEYKRIKSPQIYKVDLSDALYSLKQDMLIEKSAMTKSKNI